MKYLQQLICLCCLLLSGFETLSAEKIYVEETHFPRKALVKNDCVINTLVSEVEVGGNKDFNNIMDTDLDNYGTIVGVASVGTLVKPMLLVKIPSTITRRVRKPAFAFRRTREVASWNWMC